MQKMRRNDRLLSMQETEEILQKAEYMVLALSNNEMPYAVPLSFVYSDGFVYFHCALEGKKIDFITNNSHCCLAIVGETKPLYKGYFTTLFESVVIFGTAHEIVNQEEKKAILQKLADKYLPEHSHKAMEEIVPMLTKTAVYAVKVDEVTGKAKR